MWFLNYLFLFATLNSCIKLILLNELKCTIFSEQQHIDMFNLINQLKKWTMCLFHVTEHLKNCLFIYENSATLQHSWSEELMTWHYEAVGKKISNPCGFRGQLTNHKLTLVKMSSSHEMARKKEKRWQWKTVELVRGFNHYTLNGQEQVSFFSEMRSVLNHVPLDFFWNICIFSWGGLFCLLTRQYPPCVGY